MTEAFTAGLEVTSLGIHVSVDRNRPTTWTVLVMSTSFAHSSVEKTLGERTAVMVLEESSAIVSPLNGCSSNVVQILSNQT